MATTRPAESRDQTSDGAMRRRLLIVASVMAILALLHFVDHAVRGELVISGGLDPTWNHSGWPFNTHSDTPYIFPLSFVVVSGLLLGGMFFTQRGRLWAGSWLGTSIFLFAFLLVVHFVGFSAGSAETPRVIALSYRGNLWRVLALTDLFGMFAVLIALAFQAVKTRRRSGRW